MSQVPVSEAELQTLEKNVSRTVEELLWHLPS